MPRFHYKAVASDGEVIEGELDAADRAALIEQLRQQGHLPIQAAENRGGLAGLFPTLTKARGRVPLNEIALLTRELAILLQSGLPLDRALSILIAMAKPGATRSLVERILDKIRGGASLGDALESCGTAFPEFYVGMVRAGEAGGTLETVLVRVADTLDRSQALKEQVRSALQYPTIVLVVAGLSLIILITWVVPNFRPLFEEAGEDLPFLTRGVVFASDILRDYWWAMVGTLLVGLVIFKRRLDTTEGRLAWDRWRLRAPIIGELVTKVEVARLTRTLGTLLSNGVTVLNAISMTANASDNTSVAESLNELRGRLTKGEGLAIPLAELGFLPPLALQLIQIGEESGQLETMLLRVADIYDTEVKRTIERLLGLLVPIITIGLGILIAVIIGSMLMAILSAYDLPI
ncbi:MAG: type II secretion system F family protein [Pseudomonadota bacterium]